MEMLFFHIYKIYIFIVKYSDTGKHKEQLIICSYA